MKDVFESNLKVMSFQIPYFFSDIGVKKYYSRLGRVLVELDRDKMTFKCVGTKGSKKKCVHQKFCLTVS